MPCTTRLSFLSLLVALIMAGCLSAVAYAVPIIDAGDHDLLPNTPDQVIPILISGVPGAPPVLGGTGEGIQGLNFNLTVNDFLTGPLITAVDIIGPGTVFFGNNTGQRFLNPEFFVIPGRRVSSVTTTESGYVDPNGVLGFVTLDTTGIAAGSYALRLVLDVTELPSGGFIHPSSVPPFVQATAPELIDGTLTVLSESDVLVPEPSSVLLGMLGAAGLGAVLMRQRRKTA